MLISLIREKAMHRLGILFRTMVPGLVLVLLIGGCSVYDKYFGKEEELSPEQLMSEGLKSYGFKIISNTRAGSPRQLSI